MTSNSNPDSNSGSNSDSNSDKAPENDELISEKMNMETGKLSWEELQRHFAKGVVIKVANNLDLVEVAVSFSKDEKERVQEWLETGLVARTTDADAIHWDEADPAFWAVVAAPWVLVQEITIQ